jgi:hypothetical protein
MLMSVKILPGPPIDEARLNSYLRTLQWQPADDYVKFLRELNGGTPPEGNAIPCGDFNATVRFFYSVGAPEALDIAVAMDQTGPFPSETIPVACDWFGNSFLLRDTGEVYFWDHERELEQADPEEPDFTPATLLAESFTEFLQAMRPPASPENP